MRMKPKGYDTPVFNKRVCLRKKYLNHHCHVEFRAMLILGSAGKGYCLQGYNLSLSFPVVCVEHLMTTRMMRKQSEGSQFGTPSLLSDSLAWMFL